MGSRALGGLDLSVLGQRELEQAWRGNILFAKGFSLL